jgi:hypothetical protein
MGNIQFGSDDLDQGSFAEMEKDLKGNRFVNKFYTLPDKEGTYKIRVIPNLQNFGEKVFYKKFTQHWINRHPYVCLNQNIVDKNGKLHEAEDCPICKAAKKYYNLAGEDKKCEEFQIASNLVAKPAYISRILARGRKDDAGNDVEHIPVFYQYGKTIFEMLFNFLKSGEFGNFLSVKNGRDFNVVKTGSKRNVKYSGSYIGGIESPILREKDKLELLLTELEKMDYNQLFELSSAEAMSKAVHDYLNPSEEEDTEKEIEEISSKKKVVLGENPEDNPAKNLKKTSLLEDEKDDYDPITELLNSI